MGTDSTETGMTTIPEVVAHEHRAAAYIADVASDAPIPGGGSVAGTVGALAAALGEMVCRLSVGKRAQPGVEDAVSAALSRLTTTRSSFMTLALRDERAYASYRRASKMPKSTMAEKAERRVSMQAALVAAALVPLDTARAGLDLLGDIAYVAEHGSPHVRSDAVIAAILADAAIRASAVNVRVNTGLLRDRDQAADLDATITEIENAAAPLVAKIV